MKRPRLNSKKLISHQGFSLIEILVALVLVSLVMGLAITNPFSGNQNLENEVKNLERAITYMGDESALRNTITRLHIYLNKEPQEYSVEYGPSANFVLPIQSEDSINVMTKDDEEKKKKDQKDLNMKFTRLTEFKDSNNELDDSVKIIAFGTSSSKTLQTNGEISVYAYPSGEKDEVFIALSHEDSIATITTSAFSSKIVHNYYHLDNTNEKPAKADEKELGPAFVKAKEMFETWLKEKK